MFEPASELGEFRCGELRAGHGQAEGVRDQGPSSSNGSGEGAWVMSNNSGAKAATTQAKGRSSNEAVTEITKSLELSL